MTQTTAAADAWLKLILQAVGIANLAINATVAPLTQLFISLHTASPGVGGDQTTNEATYTGYTRIPVARTAGGWAVVGNVANPLADITFPICSAGAETIRFMGIGSLVSGAGALYWYGGITPNIAVAVGVTPNLTTATAITGT